MKTSANTQAHRLKKWILNLAVMLFLAGALAQTDSDGRNVYKVGGSVSAPRAKHSPPPEYSKQALDAKYQGTCVLGLIVGTDGLPRDVKIIRSLGLGLDEKAIEAVKQWKFKPAMKDGKPVAVQINVEVFFRLYDTPTSKSNLRAEASSKGVVNTTYFTQEQLAKLAAEWSKKTQYTQPQLAELCAKCSPYINTRVEDLESKQAPLPPHECGGVLGWMRSPRVESLYISETPPQ
jgi:TonB family protein